MITLDGSHGEGGGQIIRIALALSMHTGQAFRAINIRAGRQNPGLKAQHIACINALTEISNARAEHTGIGANELTFYPGKITKQKHTIDIGTAGSITLVLQSLLLPLSFSSKKSKIKLIGGTDVPFSMPVDYFSNVLAPALLPWAEIKTKLIQRGYAPEGKGVVEVSITPHEKPIVYVREQKLQQVLIKGISHATKNLEERQVAERQARAAEIVLNKLHLPVLISSEYVQTADIKTCGSGITLWLVCGEDEHAIQLGGSALGSKRKTAEQVGQEAAQELIAVTQSEAPVDKHLADNLISWLGVAGKGSIQVQEITEHTKSAIYVVEQFLPVKFKIEGKNIQL
ncbi:MAG: RNA 3'-terminal phosphate cyclase [Candidatus Woesearchaeota archaeon]|nr:RNA 3'-terminal phosphate cyclase [Candidatus Woesearchaeota archaeon]